MSPSRLAEAFPSPTALPPAALWDDEEETSRAEVAAEGPLSLEDIRHVVGLVQCPRCSLPLSEPVTLPCGQSLCHRCMPQTRLRANISYPGTAARLQGFQCPFPACSKTHTVGDCAVDITLRDAVARFRGILAGVCRGDQASDMKFGRAAVTGLRVGISDDRANAERWKGFLVETYLRAEQGLLRYSDPMPFTRSGTGRNEPDAVDLELLRRARSEMRQEMLCQVCLEIFCDPFTTPCGHTFCRHCLRRSLDTSAICPVCRQELSIPLLQQTGPCPTNACLAGITHTYWPAEVETRKMIAAAEADSRQSKVPVFVCGICFPSTPTMLHVFEPRYRLMIRRALDGDRTFGLILGNLPGQPANVPFQDVGTIVKIRHIQFFEDGRSLLEAVGISRFRIRSHTVVDGYVVAETDKVDDIGLAEEEEREASETTIARRRDPDTTAVAETGGGTVASDTGAEEPGRRTRPCTRADLDAMPTQELMEFASTYLERLPENISGQRLALSATAFYGPPPTDPATLPWWYASIFPLSLEQKYRLLNTTSVRARLKMCCAWILEWDEFSQK